MKECKKATPAHDVHCITFDRRSPRYLNLVREAIKIRRHFDLLCWLQGPVQRFLPHQILIAAWGDFGLGLIHHDVVSNLPSVRTQFSDAETLRRLLCGLYDRWVLTEKAPYIIGVDDSGFSLNDSSLQCALGSALKGMRNAIVHGIRDERGRHDCLYVMFSSDNARDSQGRSAVAYLLPYLDAAMRQVAHHQPKRASPEPQRMNRSILARNSRLGERKSRLWNGSGWAKPTSRSQ